MVSVAQVVDFFTSVLKGAWLGMDELEKAAGMVGFGGNHGI